MYLSPQYQAGIASDKFDLEHFEPGLERVPQYELVYWEILQV